MIEDIIMNIINKTGKSRNEVDNLIEKKQLDANGAISNKAAARLVSEDLGISTKNLQSSQASKIQDLHHMAPGSTNIVISGLVERVYHPHQFQRDETTQFVQNMLLRDETSTIQLVLWGKMVGLVHKLRIKKGGKITVIKSILKNGRLGERELHLNDHSTIQIIPDDTIPKELTSIDTWGGVLLPGTITLAHSKDRENDVQGIVVKRHTITPGKPLNFHLVDPSPVENSPTIRVVVWGDRVEEFVGFDEGTEILLEGIQIKEGYQSKLEIHVNRRSNLTILSQEPIDLPTSLKGSTTQQVPSDGSKEQIISNLNNLLINPYQTINLRILWTGKLSKFTRKDNTSGQVIRIGVYDNTGSNVLVLWDGAANTGLSFSTGNLITATEVYFRNNRGILELSLGKNGNASLAQNISNDEISKQLPAIPINSISESWKSISLWGQTSDISDIQTFQRQDGTEGQYKTLKLIDNTGEIRIAAWENEINLLDNLTADQIVNLKNLNVRKNKEDGWNVSFSINSEVNTEFSQQDIPDWAKNIQSQKQAYQSSTSVYNRILLQDLTEDRKNKIATQQQQSNTLDSIQFRAMIVDIDDRWIYYDGCPKCAKKVTLTTDAEANCPNHGSIHPVPKLLLRVTFDDGTKLLSGSLLGSIAERVTQMNSQQVQQFLEQHNHDDKILLEELKQRLIGHEYLISGRLGVRESTGEEARKYWDLKINSVSQPDPVLELKILEEPKAT